MTAEEYRKLLEVDFGDVELGDLADVGEIRIDRRLPVEERRKQYVRQTGNPYMARCGEMKIKVRFANNGVSLYDAFEHMLMSV